MSSVTLIEVETRSGWRYFADTGGIIIGRQPYDPRVEATGGYFRHLFAPTATLGPGAAEAKPVLLANADRALDGLHRAVDGRRIVIRTGDRLADGRPSGNIDDYPVTFQGRIETARFPGDSVELAVLSRQTAIAEALVTDVRFDGTATSGGAGVGGNAELAGKPLPTLVGTAFNFLPPYGNAFDYVLCVSRGWPGHSAAINAVRDAGVALTAGTARATLALLLAASPASGEYDWYSGDDGTWIKLGAKPAGAVKVDATEGGGRTVARVAEFLLSLSPEVSTVNGGPLMDSRAPWPAGRWIGPEDTALGVALEDALRGVGSWTDDLSGGGVTLRFWDAPQAPVAAIAEWEVLDDNIELLSSNDAGGGSPIRELLVGYRRNYSPDDAGTLDSAVDTDVASLLGQEWSIETAADPDVLAANPLAQTLRLDTALATAEGAAAIAAHHLDLRKSGIDIYRAPLPTSRVGVDIGQTITLTARRFGLSDVPGGAVCGVLGRDTTGRRVEDISQTDLILWRPTP
jgi:hypothetical protein